LGEGIQVCSNEGDCPSSRRDNSKRIKIHWKFLKSSSPEPASQIQSGSLQRGGNHKNVKMGWCHLKIFSRTTSWANFNQTYLFSSPELKAQVSYSDRPLSVVRLSVCPSVLPSVRSHESIVLRCATGRNKTCGEIR
jgi:hypothetical protein